MPSKSSQKLFYRHFGTKFEITLINFCPSKEKLLSNCRYLSKNLFCYYNILLGKYSMAVTFECNGNRPFLP